MNRSSLEKWLYDPTIGKLVTVLVGIVLVIIIVRFIQKILSKHIKDTNTRYRIRKFITFSGYILGFLVIITVFSDKLGGFTVALGVAGAGIAFALQEVIVSIAGWFAISLANFYKTGDRIKLGGIKGDVIDIGVLRSTIMEIGEWVTGDLYNGRVVRVANSFIFKEPVYNYSGDFPFLWDEITVPIKYGSEHKLARKIVSSVATEVVGSYANYAKNAWNELVKKYMIEDAKVEPMITLFADENWISFTLRYVVDYKKRRTTKDQLFLRILDEFEKYSDKIQIASSSMDITILNQNQ
jgi:small-conductance mechanosensitive channel